MDERLRRNARAMSDSSDLMDVLMGLMNARYHYRTRNM